MMNKRIELNEEMMEQVNGGHAIGDHVELKSLDYERNKRTKSATIKDIRVNSNTGSTEYYITFNHWYDFGVKGWYNAMYFE